MLQIRRPELEYSLEVISLEGIALCIFFFSGILKNPLERCIPQDKEIVVQFAYSYNHLKITFF